MALIVVCRSSAGCRLNDTLLLELFPHNLVSLSPHNRCANDEQVCASSAILIDLIFLLLLITRMLAMIIFARGVFQILMTAGLLPSPLLFLFSNIHLFLSPPILISVALTIAIMVKSTRIQPAKSSAFPKPKTSILPPSHNSHNPPIFSSTPKQPIIWLLLFLIKPSRLKLSRLCRCPRELFYSDCPNIALQY